MSNVPHLTRDESPLHVPLGRAVVPMLVAAGAVTLALAVVRAQPSEQSPAASPEPSAGATPYSDMHRRVQESPGAPGEQPPTF